MYYELENGRYKLTAPGVAVYGKSKQECFDALMLAAINKVPMEEQDGTVIDVQERGDFRIGFAVPSLRTETFRLKQFTEALRQAAGGAKCQRLTNAESATGL